MSDAWIFASLGGTGRRDGLSLQLVTAAADGINHAIPTEVEFTRAVPRLVAAELAGADPVADRYWHTDAGHALYQRATKGAGCSAGWTRSNRPWRSWGRRWTGSWYSRRVPSTARSGRT